MAGATSIIKSSNFDGTSVGNGSYANATAGWLINGQGRAYFYDATIVGSIDIGGFDSGSFHVDIEGNMWLGAGVFEQGTFRVTKEGDAYANSLTTNSVDLKGNTEIGSNGKIYLGAGNYKNSDTPFYVDSDSQFSLGEKLYWDGSLLTIIGSLRLQDGSLAINEDDAEEIANSAASNAVDEFGNSIYEDGFIGGLTITGNKLYYGSGLHNDTNTGFYVGQNQYGQADFSLGNSFVWTGTSASTGSLVVKGHIDATGGSIGGWLIQNDQIIAGNGAAGAMRLLSVGNDDGKGEIARSWYLNWKWRNTCSKY